MALPINIEELLGGSYKLKKNGSPDSVIEADDEHTYFIIHCERHQSVAGRRQTDKGRGG